MPKPETQFSIYKIDFDQIEAYFDIKEPRSSEKYIDSVIYELINRITEILKEKTANYYKFSNNGFNGIVFKTTHKPAWKEVALQLLSIENINIANTDKFLSNTNVSYVFTYKTGSNLYACTGGYGSNYISKFVVKNFGLYLLPKIIDSNNQVIKNVVQNNLVGNQTSTNKVNRNNTSVSNEQDMSSIFRQLTVEASRSQAESLGVVFDEEESSTKKTSIINKDSLVIRRSFSLQELVAILSKISDIEEKDDAFALNYMVLARKKGLKNSELKEKLIADFSLGDFSRFVLVGDDYEQYYINTSKYLVINSEERTVLLEKHEPITIADVFELVMNKEGKTTKSAINKLLNNWQIETFDNNGNIVLYPIDIYDAIQGFVEFGTNNMPCYLFNGNWYVFDNQYESLLNKEFESFYEKNEVYAIDLKHRWKLKNKSNTEDLYNEALGRRSDIIVAHKATLGNIEIADVIFWENDTVYFMHNKMTFDGAGSRDLTNQILSAAEYFQIRRMSTDRTNFFKGYYEKINQAAKKHGRQLSFNEGQFVEVMEATKHFCFIAGYLCNYSKNSRATYAKYLSLELKKKLTAKGFGCYILGLD